jgi:cellulose synthase/poly-beta-1,6-N-acetylglucosamine synthase-like glycosyltransferase
MMAYTHPAFDVLFLLSVVVLWAMIFYQMVFTFMGYRYYQRCAGEKQNLDRKVAAGLPPVSVLIPAHNEALVIRQTLVSLLRLEYDAPVEILVIDDGSTDETAGIVQEMIQADSRIRLIHIPEPEAARGKSHALNFGLKKARHDIVAVYDADNTPEPDSLQYLVRNLIGEDAPASCFGKFRTRNRNRSLVTRFINLETLAFQFMIQAGRYLVSRVAILPGTNLVIRKEILAAVGGWDEDALTEDTELSIRLYENGHEIKFVPYAVTWEEEPETWAVWLKQRTRWVRGNFYVLRKYLVKSFRFKKISLAVELVYLFLLYYLFLGAILLSHIFFVLSAFGLIAVLSPGPYFAVWACAFVLFVAELMLAASYEGEADFRNLTIVALMYFTYCQAWIVLVFRGLYQDLIQTGETKWEKTKRIGDFPIKENRR